MDDSLRPVVVIGLGYVGVAAAASFLKLGVRVLGVDRDAAKLRAIAEGPWPFVDDPEVFEVLQAAFATGRFQVVSAAESSVAGAMTEPADWIVCVDTPFANEAQGGLDAGPLDAALELVASLATADALVCIESTLPPGTMASRIEPGMYLGLARRGLDPTTLLLAHCPQRVMPGRLLLNVTTLPRALGVSTEGNEQARARLKRLYPMGRDAGSAAVAEMTKLVENAYRAVNIAFANEVAQLCEASGVSFQEVRAEVNRVPGRALLQPGPGVGGACLTKDTQLLASAAKAAPLLQAALAVNAEAPMRTVQRILALLDSQSIPHKKARLAVFGLSYRENSSVAVASPAAAIVAALQPLVANVAVHDPTLAPGPVLGVAQGADMAVFLVAHDVYRQTPWDELAATLKTPLVFDARAICPPSHPKLVISGIGRPGPVLSA
jgi:UDP-N-acetyl-D-mannosaminuronic acid dehydrogenase